MARMKILKLIPIACIVLATSCTTRLTDFTLISGKNIDIAAAASLKRSNTRVTGTDIGHIVLGIPVKFPNMKSAMDNAVEQTPGAVALVDGVVYQQNYTIVPILYSQSNYKIEGTPLLQQSTTSVKH